MKVFYIVLISLLLVACNSKNTDYINFRGSAFGTTYAISYLDNKGHDYQNDIDILIQKFNQSLSTYIPESDISKINEGIDSINVDAYFKEVFYKSKQVYKMTDGYFDPTVGNIVNAWGFGPKDIGVSPDSLTIDSLMQYVGFNKVSIKNNYVVKDVDGIYFDFNAVAKGYGIDVIARFLEENGISNYLVEIGGEVRCKGKNEKGTLWQVGIEAPNEDGTRSLLDVVGLENEAMATSGNYRKFTKDSLGLKYVHTINPITGWANPSNLLSVSVISNGDCADVDAYATAFMAMGKEKTESFLYMNKELKAYMIFSDSLGNVKSKKINFK